MAGKLVRDELKRCISNGEVNLRIHIGKIIPIQRDKFADSLNVCNVNNSCIKHTVQNKKGKSDTLNNPNVIKKNRLMCLYMNARCIMNQMTALEAYILEYDPDVIGITESWTTEDHLQSELQLEGYTCYRRDRMMCDRSKGGGVLLYMKNMGKI